MWVCHLVEATLVLEVALEGVSIEGIRTGGGNQANVSFDIRSLFVKQLTHETSLILAVDFRGGE
jgi:hypothetical protein